MGGSDEKYPSATYKIRTWDEKPYLYDAKLGYLVMTSVTIDDVTHEMWLPVMDGANKSMKDEPYTYQVKEYENRKWTGNYVDKAVEAATMFDINTAIMRCLVKTLLCSVWDYTSIPEKICRKKDQGYLQMRR